MTKTIGGHLPIISEYLLDAEKSVVCLLDMCFHVGHLGSDVTGSCGGSAGPLRHSGHVTWSVT